MIIVFGSINIDLVTRVAEIPKPGETVLGPTYDAYPGGKGANQALAAARGGARVTLVGAVGSDSFAFAALALLKADGVDCSHVAFLDEPTGTGFITIDSHGENAIVVASGANRRAHASQLLGLVHAGDYLLLQREVPDAESQAAARAARAAGAKIILNLAPAAIISAEYIQTLDMIVMNEHEAGVLAKAHGLDATTPEAAGRALHEKFALTTIVTLGGDGAVAFEQGQRLGVAAPKVELVDTTAAGDTFVGALAAALHRGHTLTDALPYAIAAGSLACTRAGAQPSIPYLHDIVAFIARQTP